MKPPSALKSIQQRARQKSGESTEARVETLLRFRGYSMVEKINVSFGINRATGKQFAKKKVSGDFRAILCKDIRVGAAPDAVIRIAQSVLVECKHHAGSLPYSAFRPHQIEALSEHSRLGGISLVAWANGTALDMINWSDLEAIGFGPRKSAKFFGGELVIAKRGIQ